MLRKYALRLKRLFPYDDSPLRTGKNGQFVFIHINRTAGTSIGRKIGLTNKSHLTAQEVIERIGNQRWEDAFKFTSVRDPWEKVASQYWYRIKTNQTDMAVDHISFKDWLHCTYGAHQDKKYYDKPRMFLPQVDWLKDTKGEIHLNEILRFENINEEYQRVAEILGVNKKLPHLNKAAEEEFKKMYDPEMTKIVADWFKEDIAYFGYCF